MLLRRTSMMRLLQKLVNNRLRIIVIVVFLVVTWKLTQMVSRQPQRSETGRGGGGDVRGGGGAGGGRGGEGKRDGGKTKGGRGRGRGGGEEGRSGAEGEAGRGRSEEGRGRSGKGEEEREGGVGGRGPDGGGTSVARKGRMGDGGGGRGRGGGEVEAKGGGGRGGMSEGGEEKGVRIKKAGRRKYGGGEGKGGGRDGSRGEEGGEEGGRGEDGVGGKYGRVYGREGGVGVRVKSGRGHGAKGNDGRRYFDSKGKASSSSGPLKGQDLLDYIARYLRVWYKLRQNGGKRYITLTNTGHLDVVSGDWVIVFNHAEYSYEEAFMEVARKRFLQLNDSGLILRHLDHWIYSIEPAGNDSFKRLRPNNTLTVELDAALKSRYYAFPNWYVTGRDARLKPKIIQSTTSKAREFAGDFEAWSSHLRYNSTRVDDLKRATIGILPTPLSSSPLLPNSGRNKVKLDRTWKVFYHRDLRHETAIFADRLKLAMVESDSNDLQEPKTISLAVRNVSAYFTKFRQGLHIDDGYVIKIASDKISVHGQTSGGVFYGVQSLVSLLDGSKDGLTLPIAEIVDAPRYAYRGLMLDVGRIFVEKNEVFRTLDVMAMYKLNKLHLHLTDDQGWRIEIPTLPELTEIGSRREFDTRQENALLTYFGTDPEQISSKVQYYSVQDYQDILRYANRRHIEVIPEIDMPGHAHAAVQSMRMRYRRLKRSGSDEATASRFLVHDLNDTSWYLGNNKQTDTVLNPCVESTYTFVEEVLRTLIEMHKDIQALKTIHLGGDEVPFGALTESPSCRALIAKDPSLKDNLKLYFMRRVISEVVIRFKGVRVQTWEDGLGQHGQTPVNASIWGAREITVNAYHATSAAFTFANAGYKVVLSHASRLYFDHPHEPDPEEIGLFWSVRHFDTRLVHAFMGVAAYPSNGGSSSNYSRQEVCRTYGMSGCPELRNPENIIGMQASFWGEMNPTVDEMHYMLYPRLLAFAERAWHMAEWETAATEQQMAKLRHEDWTDFANTVGYKELMRLERLGINYRLSTPGVRVEKGNVMANTEFPGSLIQYSADGGRTWNNYTLGAKLNADELSDLKFSVVSHNLRRRGRVISFSRRQNKD